jgi:hypothetical protein
MWLLLYRACNLGKDVVRLTADQLDGGDDNNQDHRKHYRIFRDVLRGIIPPNFPRLTTALKEITRDAIDQ